MSRITKAIFDQLQSTLEERRDTRKGFMKYCDPCMLTMIATKELMIDIEGEDILSKGQKYRYENDELNGKLIRTLVGNTYNWLDSHGDVHLNNTFTRSLQGRGKDAPHLHDHKYERGARVGRPLKIEERMLSWRELGQQRTGKTMALVMESEIDRKLNAGIYDDYLNDECNQHSVAMSYVKIDLACDDEENYPKEFALWEKVLPLLGNRKEAEDQGWFYVVSEAKLYEISAVLAGSNELTPTLGPKPTAQVTPEIEEEVKTRQTPDTQLLAKIEELHKTLILQGLR